MCRRPGPDGLQPDSAVRNTLNGVVTDNMLNVTNLNNGFAEAKLDESTALISAFPSELKAAIVPKAVKSDTIYNDVSGNNVTVYDKLWLFSEIEIYSYFSTRPNEGNTYSRQAALGIANSLNNDMSKNRAYDEAGGLEYRGWWLRSIGYNYPHYVWQVGYGGSVYSDSYASEIRGLAPGFVLK